MSCSKAEFAEEGTFSRNIFSSLKTLWDEIIEVSTYGPSERKMLKAQRERQKQLEDLARQSGIVWRHFNQETIAHLSNAGARRIDHFKV